MRRDKKKRHKEVLTIYRLLRRYPKNETLRNAFKSHYFHLHFYYINPETIMPDILDWLKENMLGEEE